jgi:hypothetical protein
MAILNGVLIGSIMLLSYLPLTPNSSREWFRQSLLNENILWPGPTLIVVLLLILVVVREFSWRQMTLEQSRLWLRSGFMITHRRDLLLILRRRMTLQKKQSRRRS